MGYAGDSVLVGFNESLSAHEIELTPRGLGEKALQNKLLNNVHFTTVIVHSIKKLCSTERLNLRFIPNS